MRSQKRFRLTDRFASAADSVWNNTERVKHICRFSKRSVDFAASSHYFAAVVVEEGTGASRRFRLVVLSEKGDEVLKQDLGTDAPAEGETVALAHFATPLPDAWPAPAAAPAAGCWPTL